MFGNMWTHRVPHSVTLERVGLRGSCSEHQAGRRIGVRAGCFVAEVATRHRLNQRVSSAAIISGGQRIAIRWHGFFRNKKRAHRQNDDGLDADTPAIKDASPRDTWLLQGPFHLKTASRTEIQQPLSVADVSASRVVSS